MSTWGEFGDSKSITVFSTKGVVRKGNPILLVSHDADDGTWQFHDGGFVKEEDAMVVRLEEIIIIDPTILELVDLPLGWQAWRDSKGEPWEKTKSEE